MPRHPKSNCNNKPQQSDAVKSTSADSDYKVGPGRPPKEYQWPPGTSGNRAGAKRKQPSILSEFKQVFERALNKKATITAGERKIALTKFEIGMEQFANQFATGDRYARREILMWADKLGVDLMAKHKTTLEKLLPVDHQAILDAYVDRQYDKVVRREAELAPSELLDDDVDEDV